MKLTLAHQSGRSTSRTSLQPTRRSRRRQRHTKDAHAGEPCQPSRHARPTGHRNADRRTSRHGELTRPDRRPILSRMRATDRRNSPYVAGPGPRSPHWRPGGRHRGGRPWRPIRKRVHPTTAVGWPHPCSTPQPPDPPRPCRQRRLNPPGSSRLARRRRLHGRGSQPNSGSVAQATSMNQTAAAGHATHRHYGLRTVATIMSDPGAQEG